jgi:hypothetical protein
MWRRQAWPLFHQAVGCSRVASATSSTSRRSVATTQRVKKGNVAAGGSRTLLNVKVPKLHGYTKWNPELVSRCGGFNLEVKVCSVPLVIMCIISLSLGSPVSTCGDRKRRTRPIHVNEAKEQEMERRCKRSEC